jgi:hypothetical protein
VAAVPPPVRSEVCPNCGAARASHFCPDCGQSSADPRRDFGAVVSELLGSFFAVDGRVWRSLVPLFFRPGALTRAWMDGRRATFLTPLRLLLFFSILLFLVVQTRTDTTGILLGGYGGGSILKITRDGAEDAPADATPVGAAVERNGLDLKLPQFWPFTWLRARAEAQENKFSQLSEEEQAYLLARRALELMPVALLMLLPLLAIFLKLWWLGTGSYYLDHLVFLMHAYAFLCGLLVLLMLTSPPPAVTALTLLVGVPIFLHRGLRRVYGKGFWRTAGCTLAGGVVTFMAALLVLLILVPYGMLTV